MLPKIELNKSRGFGRSLYATWGKFTMTIARFEGNFHLSVTWA